MNRRRRIETVKTVLRNNPKARTDKREYLVRVYQAYGAYSLEDILDKRLPSPEGILRDRRREEVLAEFPREGDEFDHFKSYVDEFGQPIMFEFRK